MMHGSNGSPSDRYLHMDYGMHHGHAPHPSHGQPPGPHPHHPEHPHLAAAAHYALPPSHHAPLGAAPPPSAHHGMKRSPESAGLDMMSPSGGASSDEEGSMHDVKPALGDRGAGRGSSLKGGGEGSCPPAGKKTKGRVKIKMEFIDNKLRRYTTFSKRKTGIMKKAYELSTLTGTQVMLLVASETGHVYTFATRKLQPMITSDAGKALIQTCLNSPDPPPQTSNQASNDQRMSASGYEETELTYNAIADAAAAAAADAAEQQKEHNFEEQDSDDEEEEEIEISEQQQNQISDEDDDEEDGEQFHDHRTDQQRRSVVQHGQRAGGSGGGGSGPGGSVAHPQHQLHPSAGGVMGPSVHHQTLFSTTSSQAAATSTASSSNTSTSISTGGSNLPPEVISQLLATGHLVREDGTLVRLTSVPSAGLTYSFSPSPGTSSDGQPGTSSVTITAKDLSKKSNPSLKK